MNSFFIIVLIVIFVIYYLTKNNDNFEENKTKNKLKKRDYLHDLLKFRNKIKYNNNVNLSNLYFVEAQFNNDYRDTITAFNNIAPSQKPIFNLMQEYVKFTNPRHKEVNKLINNFIIDLNENIMTDVTNYLTTNSRWDEVLEMPKCESGWDKQMKRLGLPPNLYNNIVNKEKIKLIKLDHVEKYETKEEIKYVCYLFIKKPSVKDILIIKVSFIINKTKTTNVIIEEIFIVGFMTDKNVGLNNNDNNIEDKFYNYENLNNNDGMINDQEIINQLNIKLEERHRHTQNFDNTLDKQSRLFKEEIPQMNNYNSYQVTQTIYDDILKPKCFT
jgi:hypothetical protein